MKPVRSNGTAAARDDDGGYRPSLAEFVMELRRACILADGVRYDDFPVTCTNP